QHRMSRGFQSGQLLLYTLVLGQRRVNVGEDAVVAVNIRRAKRLSRDRHDAPALLAGAFRDQLFNPEAERVQRRRRDQSELIAAGLGQRCKNGAETRTRVLLNTDCPSASVSRS